MRPPTIKTNLGSRRRLITCILKFGLSLQRKLDLVYVNPALAGSIGTIALEFAKEREAPMKELGEDYHLFGHQLAISCGQMELPKIVVVFTSRPIDQVGHDRAGMLDIPSEGNFQLV